MVSSWSCFCWSYGASPSSSAKNIMNLILVLTIWWCPCVESSLCCWKRVFVMSSTFSWQNSISLCHASFCIPAELFKVLKNDAIEVLNSICQQIWKTLQRPQDWKRSVFIPVWKNRNARECWNYYTVALFSHASKVMRKIPQARLQKYANQKFQMYKLSLEKAKEAEIKLPTSFG